MEPGATRPSAAGFTIIELVVAVSLIVIVLVPVTTVFWAGLKTSGESSHRTDGVALATRESEALHAAPYPLIGFYSDQSAPAWKGNTTVVLGSCSTTCPTPFAPLILAAGTSTPVPGNTGITYSIARYIYWADSQGLVNNATSTTFRQAYKATTVTVGWTDQAGSHSVEQDSIVYPGGQGVYTGAGGAVTTTSTIAALSAPGTPILTLALVQPLVPLNQSEIDLAITAPITGGTVSFYTVQWSTDPLFATPPPASSPQLPATSTSYAAQNLASGTTWFLRIFAGNAAGQSAYSVTVTGATLATPPATTTTVSTIAPVTTTTTVPTCLLGAFTITTATVGKTYLAKSGTMSENLVLSLSVNGLCALVTMVASVLHGTVTADPGAPYQLLGPVAGGQWSTTVASSGQAGWAVGIHDMTVRLSGTATLVTHGLLICTWKPPGQRSPSSNAC